jgi:hypothetical protein
VLVSTGLAGCSSGGTGSGYVTLTKQTSNGVHWQLDASSDGSHLCMYVDGPKGPRDTSIDWVSGACGFDDSPTEGGGYFETGMDPGDTNSYLNYGPLPADATQIRVATNEVVPTYPLPSGKGLPKGRFWFIVEGPGWPSKADGKIINPIPLNSSGKPVDFKNF